LSGLGGGEDRLSEFQGSFRNPGKLRALCYVPEGLKPGAALVVVLHGCTQNAAGYDQGSGWSRLADRHGFAVLFPEQTRGNNANLCFNWYEPGHSRRGRGEAASIDADGEGGCGGAPYRPCQSVRHRPLGRAGRWPR
jgi:poly(3-hydroxybutyrate) depolymerase